MTSEKLLRLVSRLRFAVGVAPQRPSALYGCFVIKELRRSYSSDHAEAASMCRNLLGAAKSREANELSLTIAEHVYFPVENADSFLHVQVLYKYC